MEKNLKSHSDEIDIPEEEPFKNCALDRKKYAEILTDIVSVYSKSGCVLALNGEWGSGKTTFVKMWKQLLTKKGFQTLYFNAWESDYTTDPLIAMLSEFKSLKSKNSNYKKLISAGGRIALSAGVVIIKDLIKKTTGVDSDAIGAAVNETSNIGNDYLAEYEKQKSSFKEFKESLKKFVGSNTNDDKPIVFFVDELDRCNPTYAVKVLERIKHLFDIHQIVFVLAVNKEQLSYAIQGYFGSSQMNANAYLRRFIDIEYTLPEPDMKEYCSLLYDIYGFKDFFENPDRRKSFPDTDEKEDFLEIASSITQDSHLSLRTVDKIFAHTRLTLLGFKEKTYLFPDMFFLLCYWKITDTEFYNNIKIHKYSIQELIDKIEEKIPHSLISPDKDYKKNDFIIYTIGELINSYNCRENGELYETFIIKSGNDDQLISPFECNVISKAKLAKVLKFYSDHNRMYPRHLKYIFNRIELLENFNNMM